MRRYHPLTVVKHLVLCLLSLAFAGPFVWVIATSLKASSEFFSPNFLPMDGLQWENYTQAFVTYGLAHNYFNSLTVTVAAVGLGLAIALLAAYGMFRLRFRFRNTVFVALVVVMMMPPQLTLISQFLLFQKSGILYSPLALILPYTLGVLPLSVFILRSFFKELPIDLDHAARMDGATDLQIVRLVLLPLSVPVLATAGILTFIQTWNEFLLASIFVRSDWATIPVAVANINNIATQDGNQPMKFAAVVLSFLPLFVLFLFLQRFFVKGLASGGVKG
ncbi:carbohydrate ABC transporter permease [Devosia algicola]|uniref:Carbohydrate ABC transporter permease n=1 Tax=Devosia algicola TaxID=3026418 RepID=A0ABY7YLB8_9HYPH|nr:carbohydrate ABC transporter permease [Devosia algicola]WDR01963.1 carbohydrate ABC transporter permease [Devosia algicola]